MTLLVKLPCEIRILLIPKQWGGHMHSTQTPRVIFWSCYMIGQHLAQAKQDFSEYVVLLHSKQFQVKNERLSYTLPDFALKIYLGVMFQVQ